MTKIIGSPRTFTDITDEETLEFVDIVSDIVANEDYQKLKNYTHHYSNTRYQHCLNVAWYTYIWCRRANLNYRSAARGAMLHDFYLYDQHKDEQPIPGRHSDIHPQFALANAEKYFDVDPIMRDCIMNHMFPTSLPVPQTKEGLIVTLADKYCASLELGKIPIQLISPDIARRLRLDAGKE